MSVHVHIERLVIDGLPVTSLDAPAVQGAIERQAAEVIAARGLSPDLFGGATAPRTESMRFAATDTPRAVGKGIADAVCRSVVAAHADSVTRTDPNRSRGRHL
jgi:hypothetical protein